MRVGPHPHALALGHSIMTWGPTPKSRCSVDYATARRLTAVARAKTAAESSASPTWHPRPFSLPLLRWDANELLRLFPGPGVRGQHGFEIACLAALMAF